MKKIKGLKKVKKFNKFGIGKFIVIALVLGGGLVYGTQMVQKNQDNRSNAMKPGSACKCSNPKYGSVSSCVKGKGKWICPLATTPINKPTATPTEDPKKCTNNTSKCSDGQMYFCNDGAWKTGVKCPTSKCEGNTCEKVASTPTPVITCTYNGVTIFNGRSQCVNRKTPSSEASVLRVKSEMIDCVNGKAKKVAVYQESNCTVKEYDKNENMNNCNDGMRSGESICFNVGSNSSEMRTCVGGGVNSKVVAYYAVKDCGKIGD